MIDTYHLALTGHIISFTAWMAGMFYLPRLYAYHVEQPVGSAQSELFKVMERRLLRIIINPAMISTWLFGLWLGSQIAFGRPDHWFDAKGALLICMQLLHAFFARTRRKLANDERPRNARFYKIINEIVTLAFLGIVALAVIKPF